MSDDKPKPSQQFTELRTPLQIVNRIQWVLHYLRLATKTINDLREEYVSLKDDYQLAFKQARIEAEGTVAEREDQAYIKTADLKKVMDTAEQALQFAKEKKSDLDSELSALQTEAGLVKKEMELTGKLS